MKRRIFFMTFAAPLVALNGVYALALPGRVFPPSAKLGFIRVHDLGRWLIDDTIIRPSPGLRLFNEMNMLVLPIYLVGREGWIVYTQDIHGMLQNVWVLRPEEVEQLRKEEQLRPN